MWHKVTINNKEAYVHEKTKEFIESNGCTLHRFVILCKEENICPFVVLGYMNRAFQEV